MLTDNSNRTILNNCNQVGRDCVTFIYTEGDVTFRTKLYNKYVCQITCPGVNYNNGNHSVNLVNSRNQRFDV